MLPEGMLDELARLRDEVTPVPFNEVRPAIEEACGPITRTFEYIEESPIAAASVAQVHRAVLKDGRIVAVKVQRPGIREIIETDITILESLAQRLENVFTWTRVYNPTGMVREFSIQIRKELDFQRDGKNAERLGRNMIDIDQVRVPAIFWEMSNSTVLVMEYIEGVRVDDVEAIRALGLDTKFVARKGFEAYIHQIFRDGFFHGDPHPGNLLVTSSGDLVFLDFGIVGIIRPERRRTFSRLLLAIADSDVDRIISSFQELGIVIRDDDMAEFKDELYLILSEYAEISIGQYDMRSVLEQFTGVMGRYHLQVPLSLMQLIKVLMMIMDVGEALDPKFNFLRQIEPYLKEIAREQFVPSEVVKKASRSFLDFVELATTLPQAVNDLIRNLSTGKVKLELVDTDIVRLGAMIDRASDKILMGLVTAAIVIGSSLVLLASGVAVTGVIYTFTILCYIVAFCIGFYALYKILLKGREN
jgi:ubiquinone biosynthesis protein